MSQSYEKYQLSGFRLYPEIACFVQPAHSVLLLYSIGFRNVTIPPVIALFPHSVQLFALTPLFSASPPYPCGLAGCLLCVPLPSLPNPASQLNPVLWSIQQQCVYTVVHTQHPGGFPPAGAIKGAAQEIWLQILEQGRKWAKQ